MEKRRIIVISIIILLIIAIFIILINLIKVKQYINNNLPDEEIGLELDLDNELERVSIRNNFYIVKNCIYKFYLYTTLFNNADELNKEKYVDPMISMLDEDYISYNNITKDNIGSFLPKMNKVNLYVEDMYVTQATDNIYIYVAYGDIINTSNAEVENFSAIIKIDALNRAFKIMLTDYVEEKYPDIGELDNIEIKYPKEIEKNDYNIYDYKIITDETYVGDVFKTFIHNMIYNKEAAYEQLDENYRSIRFPTFEKFKEYIKKNIRNISVAKLSQYQKNPNDDGYNQYICEDANSNYYIIDERSTMNCKFILDTYTIELPEFITKYNESDEYKKVALNIEKLREAINFKDYEYVYNKTNSTFKNNKFKNFAEFENYLKANLYEENNFEYENIEFEANVYIATVKITNKNNLSDEEKVLKLIMKLSENNTNYEISFDFSE